MSKPGGDDGTQPVSHGSAPHSCSTISRGALARSPNAREDHRRFGARLDARLTAVHARDGSPAAHALGACVDLARATAPDPLLPPELLPARWPGTVARDRFTAALAELLALADHAGETVPAIVRRVAAPRARV